MGDNNKSIPSLYTWAGGKDKIDSIINLFYSKVLKDDLLKNIFKHMSDKHQQHVSDFLQEVLGGPKSYTSSGGTHYGMIIKHLGKYLTEAHRKRFMSLLIESGDELGLADDPEFRSAFVGYLEWGTRLAVINSNETTIEMDENEPMPKWGWGEVGGPYLAND